MENTSNLIPPKKKQKYVRGWLSFFLFVVGFGSLFSLIMSIVGFSSVDNVGFITCLFSGIDILFSLGLVALAGYTIYAFLYIRPNAVFLGKLYVIIIFISNMLVLLSGEMPDTGWDSLPQVVKALVWSFIWFSYLCVSRQVENLFPKEERMVFKRDKYFAISLLVIPALLLLIYFISYLGNSTAVVSLSPEKGEYTDGVVAFRAPKGLLCERVDSISDNIYHSFESGDSIWGTVVGVYDTNTTEAYFKECVDSWRDTALDGYDFSVLDMNTGLVDHNVLRMQSIRYITDPRLVWTFAALFSPETGKACIISCFATTPVERTEGVVNEMLQTIRFK